MIAAFGRVIQLGGFGEINSTLNITLEFCIESARILIFLYALGLTSIKGGFLRIKRLFTDKANRNSNWNGAVRTIKKQWQSLLMNLVAFLVTIGIINYLIDLLAYETCLFLSLKNRGILMPNSSEWAVILFFKNITVIPFTLTFEAILLLWIVNKFSKFTSN